MFKHDKYLAQTPTQKFQAIAFLREKVRDEEKEKFDVERAAYEARMRDYERRLQERDEHIEILTNPQDEYEIDKILVTKGRGPQSRHYVRWTTGEYGWTAPGCANHLKEKRREYFVELRRNKRQKKRQQELDNRRRELEKDIAKEEAGQGSCRH